MTKKIFDLYADNAGAQLAEIYRRYSLGGTLRYKCKFFSALEDEFHPLWHTFSISDDGKCELKVNIRSFIKDSDVWESSDFIWFDVKATRHYVEAVCQLNSKIRFLLMGQKGKLKLEQVERQAA